MEASGVVLRQIPCVSGAAVDSHSRSSSSSSSSSLKFGTLSFSGKVKLHSNGFRDKGHVMYYNGSSRGGVKKEIKKKLKLLKGLSKDLSMFLNLGFVEDPQIESSLICEDQGKIVKEATEVLLKQLEQLKAEEKELKRKRKEEKAKLKEERKKTMVVCESSSSSSSSSESSDGECGEVIDMSRLRNKESIAQPVLGESTPVIEPATTSILPISLIGEAIVTKENGLEDGSHQNHEGQCCTAGPRTISCGNLSSVSCDEGSGSVKGALVKRIEVCMGKKCSKSGGAALLEEFERVVGVEGAVVGCKCMGKCRDGPNIRVLNSIDGIQNEEMDVSVRSMASNPLCVGVGLEDVQVIVANLFGKDREALGLTPAS